MQKLLFVALVAAAGCADSDTILEEPAGGKGDDAEERAETRETIAKLADKSIDPGTYDGFGPAAQWTCTVTLDYAESFYLAEVTTDNGFADEFSLTDDPGVRVTDYSEDTRPDFEFIKVEMDDENDSNRVPHKLTLERYATGGFGVLVRDRTRPDSDTFRACYILGEDQGPVTKPAD